jgi:hypothetical protein
MTFTQCGGFGTGAARTNASILLGVISMCLPRMILFARRQGLATGSFICRPNADAALPFTSLSSGQIEFAKSHILVCDTLAEHGARSRSCPSCQHSLSVQPFLSLHAVPYRCHSQQSPAIFQYAVSEGAS